MGSKLTLHCQGLPSWTGNFLTRAKADYVKCIGNYISHPTAKTIGRVYVDQGKVDTYVMGGASGADGIFGEVWAEVQKNQHVWIWETPANEASIWNGSVAANFVAFNQRLIQRFHDAGKRICVGAINVGWPRLPSEDGGAMMTLIYNAAKGADGLSFHEYGWDDMRQGATFYCLRYRRFHDFCTNKGWSHPPIYITECGLDRTSPPGPDFGHCGWRCVTNNNEALYLDQLIWYETELRKDSYVKAATIFTAGPSGWNSFEMYEGISMKLADKLAALGPGENTPPVAAFTYSCKDLACGFDASGSYDPDGSIAGYMWNFGDGATGSGKTASRTYAAKGSYPVKLTVTDNQAATGSLTKTVTVGGGEPGSLDVRIYDGAGVQQNAAWLKARWGNVTFPEQSSTWKVIELREDQSGSIATQIKCLDKNGNPYPGVTVTNSWPGDSITVMTKSDGTCDFSWGSGAYYPSGTTGPHKITAAGTTIGGLGWLRYPDGGYSNHWHLNLMFSQVGAEPPPQPPVKPGNVQASDGTYTDRVLVSWSASTGATIYEVYRATSTAGTKAKIGTSTGLTLSDTTATPGTTYWYWVKACSTAGCSDFAGGDSGYRKKEEEPPADRAWGITVSQYQGTIDWAKVKAAGCSFVIMRSSVGTAEDPKFKANWTGAGAVGLPRGVFHFLKPDVEGQVAAWAGIVGDRKPEIEFFSDIEDDPYSDVPLTGEKCERHLNAADEQLSARLGRRTQIYSRANFFDSSFGSPSWVAGRDRFWVADARAGATSPALPQAFKAMGWTFWHYKQMRIDGIPDNVVDVNWFNGTVEEFKKKYGLPPGPEENKPPVSSFTYAADGLAVQFDGSASTDPDGQVVSWTWTFGDGATGSGKMPIRTYAAAGTYTVTLAVTDDDGATASQTQSVTVKGQEPGPDIEEAKRLIREAMALEAEALEILEALQVTVPIAPYVSPRIAPYVSPPIVPPTPPAEIQSAHSGLEELDQEIDRLGNGGTS